MSLPVGQESAVNFLAKALQGGCSAFLFSGDEHIGKNTLALYLACLLNCPQENAPCGACSVCRRILRDSFPDVRVLGALSSEEGIKTGVSVEQIKEVLESAYLAPFEGKARVYIIENAENLTMAAANRLLKTLEEHENHVYFILLTENPSLVLSTVASRLIQVELQKAVPADINTFLLSRGVDFVLADSLSLLAEGNTGWAVMAADHPELIEIRKEQISQALSLPKLSLTERLSLVGELSKGFNRDRINLYRQLDVWQGIFRDMLVSGFSKPDLLVHKDLSDEIKIAAQLLGQYKIIAFTQRLRQTKRLLKQNVSPILALEALMFTL